MVDSLIQGGTLDVTGGNGIGIAAGLLSVTDGGTLRQTSTDGGLFSFGRINVEGQNSTLSTSGFAWIFLSGENGFAVRDGGRFQSDGELVLSSRLGFHGSALVSGENAVLAASGGLFVGIEGLSGGVLTVENNGLIDAPGGLSVDALSALNIGLGGLAGHVSASPLSTTASSPRISPT